MSKFGSSPCISLWAAAKSHHVVPELLRVPLPPRDAGVHYSSSGQMYPSVVEWLCALRLHPHTIRRRKAVRVWFQSSRQISFFSDYSFKIQNTTTTTKNLRPISVCSQNHHSEGEQNFPDILPTSTHTFLLLNHARLQVTGVSTATTTWLYNYKLTLTWVHHERINLKLLRLIWWWQICQPRLIFNLSWEQMQSREVMGIIFWVRVRLIHTGSRDNHPISISFEYFVVFRINVLDSVDLDKNHCVTW